MIIEYANQQTDRIFLYQKKTETVAINLQFSFLLVIPVQQHKSNGMLSMGDLAVQQQEAAESSQAFHILWGRLPKSPGPSDTAGRLKRGLSP